MYPCSGRSGVPLWVRPITMRTHHCLPHSPSICVGGLATGERCCWPYLTAASLSSSRDSRVFLEKEVLVDDLVNKWGRDFFRCLNHKSYQFSDWPKILVKNLIIFSVAAYMVSNNSYPFNTTAYLYHIIILIYFDPDQSKWHIVIVDNRNLKL